MVAHVDRLGAEEEIFSSMSILASCVSTNEKSSFYSTPLQVRFTVVSENRSAAISMWFKSNIHIQPTPLLSKISSFVQGRCPKLHQHGRHLSFYRNT